MKCKDAIIVMTRLPHEGRNKTRLIPALGPMGATEFHDRLARHAIGRASAYALMNPGTKLQVQLEGGSALEGQNWLGEINCYVQKDGDLGQRLQAAVEQAFSEGADRVLVMGTDCPSLDEPLLAEAFDSLQRADLVFGPAADGGYYLVGLTRPNREIFENIEWGGQQVLKQSLAAAATCGLHVYLLDVHSDVDVAEDLSAANAILTAGNTLSVIVPTLNEELHLLKLLEQLKQASPHEIIVVDGGSSDGTVALAEQASVRVIKGPRGRASQMNLAAAKASGEFLLFLHADTLPPPHYPQVISRILQSPGTSAGAFRFTLAGDLAGASLIESLVHFRCRLLGLPYGDQGLFIRRQIFCHVGGFPDWPVLEDLHMVRCLKRLGPVSIAPQAAMTSSRRWEKGGTIRTFLRHQWMLMAYYIGVPPRMIARRRS
jgi:uncharacterized protein